MRKTMADSKLEQRVNWRTCVVCAVAMLWACFGAGNVYAQGAQVYVQDSPAAQELLYACLDRLEKEEPDEAARLIQQLFDEHAAKLMEHDEHGRSEILGGMVIGPRYAEARRVAQRVLLGHEDLLASYRSQFEPLAARALEQAGIDIPKLGEVLRRYAMTDSGLVAALRLAGLGIETGEAGPALIALRDVEEHPQLESRRQLWSWLKASAHVLSGAPELAMQLKKPMSGEYAAELDSLEKNLEGGAMETTKSPLGAMDHKGPSVEGAAAPLWEMKTGGAERYLLEVMRSDESQLDSNASDGRYLSTMPMVRNGLLYVSDGEWVRAIEPSSGYEVWRTEVASRNSQPMGYRQPYSRWLPYGVDMNMLEVGMGRVVAIAGYGSLATLYPRTDSRSDLVGLDSESGRLDWRMAPVDVDGDLEDGYWYGRPIISQDRVYGTLRVRQRTQFQDAYLVAMDLKDGSVVWKRHLASTAMTDRQAVPMMGHMLLREGWLYVDSRLGTVAKISTVDGAVDWLAVVKIDPDRRQPVVYKPWQGASPVLVDAGLVVLDDWAGIVRVFDASSGLLKKELRSEDWGTPRYLMEAGGDVLGMGAVVTRVDGKTLETKWTYATGGDLSGRGSVTLDRMYVPTDEKVVVLDIESGKEIEALEVEAPATVLALEGQVIVVGRHAMGSYSTWEVASARMLERVAEDPDDARPWMAIGWLAYRTGRPESLVKSLDAAVKIVTAGDLDSALGRELFEQMMTMVRDEELEDPNLKLQVFNRIPAAIGSADQEVAYRLELGAFYESTGNRAELAVEQYQTLLEEPNYRRLLYRHEGGSRQAGVEAQRRVENLVERGGPRLYAKYEAYAVNRLKELAAGGAPEPLVELAEAYPLASVAVEALAVAAERYVERGKIGAAVGLLRRGIRQTKDAGMLARLYGREAEMYASDGQPYLAKRVLRTLMAVHPGLAPLRSGTAVDAGTWLAEMEASEGVSDVVKRIDVPLVGVERLLRGAVMKVRWSDPAAPPSRHLLLEEKGHLRLHRASDLAMLWEHEVNEGDVALLSMDRHRAWLWSEDVGRLWALDIETGKEVWDVGDVKMKLKSIADGGTATRVNIAAGGGVRPLELQFGQVRQVVQGGRIVMRQSSTTYGGGYRSRMVVGVNERAMAVADPTGHVVVYDAVEGKVLWQGTLGMETLGDVLLEGEYLVASGVEAGDMPVVVIYDVRTGVVRYRLSQPKGQEVLWMGVSLLGQLVYGSGEHVEAFDLNLGQELWRCRPGGTLTGGESVWFGGSRLVVLTDDNDLLWLDLMDGQVTSRLPLRTGFKAPLSVHEDADRWFVSSSDRIMAVDNDGRPLWRDGLSAAANMIHHTLTERYVVSLSQVDSPKSETFDWRLFMLDRRDGSVRYDIAMSSERDLDRVLGVEGRLLISGDGMTAVLGGGGH